MGNSFRKNIQFDLLAYLVKRAGAVCRRHDVARNVWRLEGIPSRKTIDMCMVSLRRQLGDDAKRPRYITTIPGVGWRFEVRSLAASETRKVDIDGVRYEVLHWEKQPFQGRTSTFTLHAREVADV